MLADEDGAGNRDLPAAIRVLRAALRARRDREITRRLDELFADPALRDEVRRGAGDLAAAGTTWADERW